MGAADWGVPESPGTMKKRVGAPRRCSSWRMIFSAAASKVNFNIFGFMPGTSIRKFAPSRVKELVLNNRAAESRPAAANAAQAEPAGKDARRLRMNFQIKLRNKD